MPRVCTVCSHPERAQIDKALVGNDSNRRIATQYSLTEAAVRRHKGEHLPKSLIKSQAAQDEASAIDLLSELKIIAQRVTLLFDACDRWLRDPDDEKRYTLDARASEISVIYDEPEEQSNPDEKPKLKRQRASLSTLLDRIEGNLSVTVVVTERRMADPRELVLKTYDRLQGQLELIAKLIGQLNDRPQINILLAPEWQALRKRLLESLGPYPDARTAVADALLTLEENEYRH